jgi:hypothetical protein
LSFQSFLYKALRSMLRNLTFYGIILHVFFKLPKLSRRAALENVIERWRRWWRGRRRSGFAWWKDAVLA